MSISEPIIRLAAKGDGVTPSGRHVAGAVPGDKLDADGVITPGAHHIAPLCRHFATCGGCQLQHADDAVLAEFVHERVVNAAKGQGLEPDEVLPVHLSPPHTRRRAGLHGLRTAKGAVLGYREGGSHRIVDLSECPVLHPALAALIAPLRAFVAAHGPKGMVGIDLTLADQGVEANLLHFPLDGLGPTEAALDFAREQGLARLTIDQGYGPETLWEPEPVTVTLSGVAVGLPPGAFLQATADAEARMLADSSAWLGDARIVADLFAGLGTFAFGLREGRKVLAVEAEQAAHLACKAAGARAGGQVLALHRDLFRSPLQPAELNRFDAVLLDPPRAGARAQVAEIAASTLARVVYVSCNPSSWARDAAVLTEAGFRLTKLRAVGQFRWSTHVELVSLFER
ncbi:MAG: class I SAM-dependent RNA methyltransferase [Erythrobacter sp.]|uniref:class I SAM-dependent RNA methyltransferase n=1 Tax=Erythrobacter sp. TaxID=1042 RepID=UPI002B49EBDF|nr:class I SAM-dependent RNA methyltransferase [Erythrobacter sp.]WRH71163.1 MAG: class I SAM-dependent RNA methyltransferase [Erythrobacter sp.]